MSNFIFALYLDCALDKPNKADFIFAMPTRFVLLLCCVEFIENFEYKLYVTYVYIRLHIFLSNTGTEHLYRRIYIAKQIIIKTKFVWEYKG